MKNRRTLAFWLALALCAATVLGAMSWLTRSVLAAERERLTAQRDRALAEARADLEERTRLALWRMDAAGAAIVLRENLVSARSYLTVDPKRPIPASGPEVRVRFQLSDDHSLTLPQSTSANQVKRLKAVLADHPPDWPGWTTRQSGGTPHPSAPALPNATSQLENALQRQTIPADQLRKDDTYQLNGSFNERSQRLKAVEQTVASNQGKSDDVAVQESKLSQDAAPPAALGGPLMKVQSGREAAAAPPGTVSRAGATRPEGTQRLPGIPTSDEVGQMRATWLGEELLLIRKVTCRPNQPLPAWDAEWNALFAATVLQGVWLDSAVLTAMLLQEITDLLPQARLVPAADASTAADPLALVSFPLKLERCETPLATAIPTTPALGTPLWVAWGGVALAFLTTTLLVRGVLHLSERRASFVSAVTHELRTPLTTFRLYSDMLESGAVKEEKRGGYLRVLAREADRLSHLVENVLAFSRIERGNARSNVREAELGELLESLRQRFEARLATAGLTLVLPAAHGNDAAQKPALRVRADLAAVEHILFNLIDNAAKYAAAGTPPEVEIHAFAEGRWVVIQVSDHGPGIPPSEHSRVFQAFHKSAREAAESQPGVGLGLALSRRLARAQGGDLVVADAATGARFLLRLPAALLRPAAARVFSRV